MYPSTVKQPTSTGRKAEAIARKYLVEQGLRILASNFKTRYGEIDLIMEELDTIVFVEVRYRHHEDFGKSLESIDYFKQTRIVNTAEHYLMQHDLIDKRACRFDVIAIDNDADGSNIEWIKNAFQLD